MNPQSAPVIGPKSWAFHTYWQDRKQKPSDTQQQWRNSGLIIGEGASKASADDGRDRCRLLLSCLFPHLD